MDELWQLKPIGYMKSVFHYKNGTPRQPAVCSHARGSVTIDKSVFNNPEHSLEGLEHFSHVWIVFLFHKNNNTHSKAKVKPPRLDGKRVGVFSTRSPHRPNAIGLTLATIEGIQGATVSLSGVDILDGTPILDLKPYIPHYDTPLPHSRLGVGHSRVETGEQGLGPRDSGLKTGYEPLEGDIEKEKKEEKQMISNEITDVTDNESKHVRVSPSVPAGSVCGVREDTLSICDGDGERREVTPPGLLSDNHVSVSPVINSVCRQSSTVSKTESAETPAKECTQFYSTNSVGGPDRESVQCTPYTESVSEVKTPSWVKGSSVPQLEVTFTHRALAQLARFSRTSSDPAFQLQLFRTVAEVEQAVRQVLNEDPRSVYRRHKCRDSLYFFSIDTVHVTAWFDDSIAEVLKIQPVAQVSHYST